MQLPVKIEKVRLTIVYIFFITADHIELCSGGTGFEKSGVDMDECKINGMCKNGKCINMEGSFKCECDLGWFLCFVYHFGYNTARKRGLSDADNLRFCQEIGI